MHWWFLIALAGCRGLLGLDDGIVVAGDGSSKDVGGDPDDRDGDGVLNAGDNCPDDANRQQENFDNDVLGDVCDPCPFLMNLDTDFDEDGVGDACDPRPLVGGDRRLVWTTFDMPNSIAGWTSSQATWSLTTEGELQQGSSSTATRITLPDITGDVFFAASFVVTDIGVSPYIGICSHVTATAFLCCDVVTNGGLTDVVGTSESLATSDHWFSGNYAALDRFDVSHYTDAINSQSVCKFIHPGELPEEQTVPESRPAGALALHTRDTAVRVSYVFAAVPP